MIKRWVIIYPEYIEQNTKCKYRTLLKGCAHPDRHTIDYLYAVFYPKCEYSKCPLKAPQLNKNSP